MDSFRYIEPMKQVDHQLHQAMVNFIALKTWAAVFNTSWMYTVSQKNKTLNSCP